jgi:glutathione S-transferase
MTVPNTGTNTNTNTNRRPVQYMDAITVAHKIWKDSYLFETDIHAIIRCGGNNNEAEEDDKEDDNKQSSSPSLSLPLPLPLPLPQFHLAYMPMRNRGEIIRLMLEESGCSYDLEIIGFKNWAEAVVVEEEEESNTCGGVKATTPQGKCPVLRNYDGKNNDLGQEGAITRYLAKELNLSGMNSIEEAEVDSLYCFWFSTMRNNGISHDGEHFSIASLRDAEPTNDRPRYQDIFRLNTLSKAERSLMALGYFEQQLDKSKSGYLLSSGLTYIDFGLFYILFELAEEDNVPDFALKFNLPKLGLFLESIQNRSKIKDYIISPSRMPRYKRDTDGTSLYTYIEGKGSPRR